MTQPTYRITSGIRTTGVPNATGAPNGFKVYSLRNGKTYKAVSGAWVDSTGSDPLSPTTLSNWYLS